MLVLGERLLRLLGVDGVPEPALACFQLRQRRRDGLARGSRHHGFDDVGKLLVDVGELPLQPGEIDAVAVVLGVVGGGVHGERRRELGVAEKVSQRGRDEILGGVLLELSHIAGALALLRAVVVPVRRPRRRGPAHALHGRAALAAEELSAEPVPGRVALLRPPALVLGEARLRRLERRVVDEPGHPVRDDDAAFRVLSEIPPVLEHPRHRLDRELVSPACPEPGGVQLVANRLHRRPARVVGEHLADSARSLFVDAVRLVGAAYVPEHRVAVVQRPGSVVIHPPLDVAAYRPRVELGEPVKHALDERGLRRVRRAHLGHELETAPRLADAPLGVDELVPVASQAVRLPKDEGVRLYLPDL